MHIAFVIYSLSAGGAERVASTLINYWVSAGEQVTLVTLDSVEKDFYRMDARVKRIALGLTSESKNWREFIGNNLGRVQCLRALFRSSEFDVVVSFIEKSNILVLLATFGLGVPVIVSERIDPRKYAVGWVTATLRRLLYPHARAVVVQTRGVGQWARRIVRKAAVYVIPNPISEQFTDSRGSSGTSAHHTVVAMGRMEPQKGFDRLLTAFAKCANRHPEWTLRIVGEGAERPPLQALAVKLGLESRIKLDTVTKEPEKVLRDSDLFVLSSRYEGFPMVLLEAMACGLPVISFDCPSGPREMIRDGIDGVLVPPDDVEALAKAMDSLMGAQEERQRLAGRAVAVSERFGLPRVMMMWSEVLGKAARADRRSRASKTFTANPANQDARGLRSGTPR
jgi:GalNAc-alpha-(1->4)-GalNAc-alpha-(1->3)-diNAcBac-PP-undecaprenol alpha-1,4-N-acetyl-D-galactosaminyltransferase